VADHIARTRRQGDDVVVVVSAMGKTTDDLIRLADEVSAVQPPREYDMLVSTGRADLMALLCMALADLGVDASSFTGSQAGIITDTDHTRAKILEVRPDRLREALAAGKVPVVAGFQGVSTDRDVTTLGRGGSDTTAVALAAALGPTPARSTPTSPGVFSADPRIVPEAHRSQPDQLRGDARDRGHRRARPDAALGRVRPQPPRPAARAEQLHLGARHLGRRGGCSPWNRPSSPR
jgi:aspartate kinase